MSGEKKQKLKEYQKIYRKAKRSKKTWFFMDLIMYAMFLVIHCEIHSILCHPYTLTEIKV